MSYAVRYTQQAKDDIERLFDFWLDQDTATAERAILTIEQAMHLLKTFALSCRKAEPSNPFLRELIIPFGANGYVAMFEIEDKETVTILSIRHQREDDFH
ncbi:type II toxin-antitoxin system RelE/ParE family toxin [Methyloradius palustris]|uniref:Plasmid stabilization protein n=1 Tax=Methyloradius palustris TaxID=2778876 RepID=A0A8D5JKF1_9PROT|nr:type II toxin-antitoxin system RelE/ParE family toxin [Methyloradius palustris]BCM23860.1 plasmid stabilization protein [Methyloradius palustris]